MDRQSSPSLLRTQKVIRDVVMQAWLPQEYIAVSQWAERYRKLSQIASSEAGLWDNSRTPYSREIMDCLSPDSPLQKVVFMKGSQIGGTEVGNNWFGYVVHYNPGPMLMVVPSLELAKRISKQRLAPMIKESPVLAERISPVRERDSGNTLLTKEFRGGVLMIAGANSAASLRSMPIKYLFLDEVDEYPGDVDGQGDPVMLAEARLATFPDRKTYLVSSPSVKDLSRIEREYENSDQRRYLVPCPDCGNYDWIQWKNIKWQDNDPSTARLMCTSCGSMIAEHHKTEMLASGRWVRTRPEITHTAGFHLSALYSPLGWKSWAKIVQEFLDAKNDSTKLKAFINTVLGETYEEEYSAKIGAGAIAERAEEYALASVPEGGLLLIGSMDVQDNRLVVKVKAWGEGEESWLINYAEIYGDPSRPEVWQQADSVFTQDYTHVSGVTMRVRAVGVDTGGHFTQEAYVYCRARKSRHVIALKGSSTPGKPAIGKPSKQDVNWRNQTIKKGVELWLIGTDTIKATVYGRLKAGLDKGPTAMHFPLGLPEEYYKQLTSEKQITKYHLGHAKRVWIKKDGARNEALDCEVYNYATLQYYYTRHNRNTIWLQLKQILDKLKEEKQTKESTKVLQKEPAAQTKASKKAPKRRPGGFVRNW